MLSLYNTLTKQKEIFTPLEPPRVKMYTCGPTVYDYVHIGNLRSYITADILRRVLSHQSYVVQHVKNITDVGHLTADDIAQGDSGEDKLVKKANAENKTPDEIATFYTAYYQQTEQTLNILTPQEAPRATEYISSMIAFIEKLIAGGHAYSANGNVFFDVTSFANYGRLSGNTLEQLKVGARLEKHPDKHSPWDFALWLRAPEGHLMHWESPWGTGYPGWHIECSAMSLATLGSILDIHTGGEDNIFPHHEAEIAQSECGNQSPFARYWVHTRHLLVDGQKMSKSKGNFYRLEDVLERGYSAMDLRMLYLGSHYRSQMNFTWEAMAQARANRESLMQALSRSETSGLSSEVTRPAEGFFESIYAALADDLNTPLALSEMLSVARWINTNVDKGIGVSKDVLEQYQQILFNLFGLVRESITIPAEVTVLIENRKEARDKKDFARSDTLRGEIAALGYSVEDGPHGQVVRKK